MVLLFVIGSYTQLNIILALIWALTAKIPLCVAVWAGLMAKTMVRRVIIGGLIVTFGAIWYVLLFFGGTVWMVVVCVLIGADLVVEFGKVLVVWMLVKPMGDGLETAEELESWSHRVMKLVCFQLSALV